LAAMDLDDLIELLDGVVIFAVIQRILGLRIQLIFMRAGFLRRLLVQQRSGGHILRSSTGPARRKSSASDKRNRQNQFAIHMVHSLWLTLPPDICSGRRALEFTSDWITRTLNKRPSD